MENSVVVMQDERIPYLEWESTTGTSPVTA